VNPWTLAWRRFIHTPSALAGVVVVGGVAAAALLAPLLAPADPLAQPDPVALQNLPPGPGHLLGTDAFSRDVLSRTLYGARISLSVGMGAALLAMIIGGAIGIAAGLGSPLVDLALMRLVDVMLALPRIFLLMAVFALWESLPTAAVIALIAVTGWFHTSRLVRAHVRELRGSEFVTAATALGAGPSGVVRHLLPHVGTTLIVSATLDVGNIVLLEAGLSFLGLGVRPPTPSWGNMIMEGRELLSQAPGVALAPGLALVLTVIAFNLVGDALRDALEPRHAR
jgi:peptide/nickel transport system permease protein